MELATGQVKRHSLPFQVVDALKYLEINPYLCPRLYLRYIPTFMLEVRVSVSILMQVESITSTKAVRTLHLFVDIFFADVSQTCNPSILYHLVVVLQVKLRTVLFCLFGDATYVTQPV